VPGVISSYPAWEARDQDVLRLTFFVEVNLVVPHPVMGKQGGRFSGEATAAGPVSSCKGTLAGQMVAEGVIVAKMGDG